MAVAEVRTVAGALAKFRKLLGSFRKFTASLNINGTWTFTNWKEN